MNVGFWKAFPGCLNKVVNEIIILLTSSSVPSKTEVEIVLEKFFVLLTVLAQWEPSAKCRNVH